MRGGFTTLGAPGSGAGGLLRETAVGAVGVLLFLAGRFVKKLAILKEAKESAGIETGGARGAS